MDKKKRTILSVMAMSFVGMSMGAVTPALAEISKVFPTAPSTTISLLATIPTLCSIPCSLLAGKFVGKQVKYRTLAITGIMILLVCGVTPIFLQSLKAIVFMRGLMGCGLGLIIPLGYSITMNTLSVQEAEVQMGRNNFMASVGGIVFQLIGGFLSNISWHYCFASYLIVIPVLLILLLYMEEPTYSADALAAMSQIPGNRIPKIGISLLFWSLFYGLFMVLFYPMITDISGIISNSNIGTSSDSALVLSSFTLGSAIGSLILSKIITRIKKYTFVISGLLCSLGFFLLSIGQNLVTMFTAAFIFGLGFGMFAPAITLFAGMSVKPQTRPFAMSILSFMGGIGSFSSAYIFAGLRNLFQISDDRFAIAMSAAVYLMITIGFLIYFMGRRRKPT